MSLKPKLMWLHLPGLTEGALRGRAGRRLRPTHHARLVAGFPWWPWSVYASMISGNSPAGHGVLRRDAQVSPSVLEELAHRTLRADVDDPSQLAPGAARASESASIDFVHLRVRFDGVGDVQSWLDAVASMWQADEPGSSRPAEKLLLTGDRPLAATATRVNSDAIPRSKSLERIDLHERVGLWQGSIDERWRETVLGVAGVDRILTGRGLELFGVTGENHVAVVLSPSHRFDLEASQPAAMVRREDPPILLGWSDEASPPWTDAVHDYRLASTLAGIVDPDGQRAQVRGANAAIRF